MNEDNVKQSAKGQHGLLGEIFSRTLGAWLAGKHVDTKLRGDREQMSALAEAVEATVQFQNALNEVDATVESVSKALHRKTVAAANFEIKFGLAWPLGIIFIVGIVEHLRGMI